MYAVKLLLSGVEAAGGYRIPASLANKPLLAAC